MDPILLNLVLVSEAPDFLLALAGCAEATAFEGQAGICKSRGFEISVSGVWA